MNTLPLLSIGSSSSGIHNPIQHCCALLPGAYYQPGPPFTGPPPFVSTVELPDLRKFWWTVWMAPMICSLPGRNQQNQPGMDSIQEWTVQTSNYAAEFGQAGSAVMNLTMKSGTNQFHGSGYEYFQNEFLNAGQPFTNGGNGNLVRPTQRRNDYGTTFRRSRLCGFPKIYNGRDKTFFFFSWEQFLQSQNFLPASFSVPTPAYRAGDFSAAITAAGSKNLGTDPLGRPIIANTIYDPLTRSVAPNGQVVTNPFPGNKIPLTRFDPVALKIQNLIPLPLCVAGPPCNSGGVVANYQNSEPVSRDTEAPSLKIDQILGPKDKLSFFWSRTETYTLAGYGEDSAPQPHLRHVWRRHLFIPRALELRPHHRAHIAAALMPARATIRTI